MRDTDASPDRPPEPLPGLCGACGHSRRIETARGSIFRLCERSATDPRFPRYPTLPVVECAVFKPGTSDGSGDERSRPLM
jgi:hypothetical protein